MIPRYSLPEMTALWTDEARFTAMLEVEILAAEAWAKLGVVPEEAAVAIRERAAFTVARIVELKQVSKHNIVTFIRTLAESIGPDKK